MFELIPMIEGAPPVDAAMIQAAIDGLGVTHADEINGLVWAGYILRFFPFGVPISSFLIYFAWEHTRALKTDSAAIFSYYSDPKNWEESGMQFSDW